MPRTYVIADLHGRYDLLQGVIEKIAEHAGEISATLITLGDYIDRGPDSKKVIETLMEMEKSLPAMMDAFPEAPRRKLVCLKGNHEEMMLETIRKPLDPGWWIGNGGGHTLMSYGHESGLGVDRYGRPRGVQIDLSVVPAAHLDWIDKLPYLHTDKHRIYVHAGVDPDVPLAGQADLFIGSRMNQERLVTWRRYGKREQGGYPGWHVVHGHDQYEDGPMRYQGRTNLDTFAWYTGRLVVGVFDDDTPGGPIDLIEVRGPHQNDT